MNSSADPLSSLQWKSVVQRRLGNGPYTVLRCELRELDSSSGFLGEHRFARLEVRDESSLDLHTLHFFVKTVPQSGNCQQRFLEELGVCEKEVDIFSHMFPDIKSTLKCEMLWVCECYFACGDVLVLEDLNQTHFSLVSNRQNYDLQHIVTALKTLADFHATSLIYEETNQCQLIEKYPELLQEIFFVDQPGHPGCDTFWAGIEGIFWVAEYLMGIEEAASVRDGIVAYCRQTLELELPSSKYRNVVCHGDLWQNNIFFNYEKKQPREAKFVDFQLLRYSPPANDIMCLLHLTTSREFRSKHLQELLKIYYNQLSKNLKRYDLDPEQILPWSELRESCDLYRVVGVTLCAVYCQLTVLPGDLMMDVLKDIETLTEYMRGTSLRRKLLPIFFARDAVLREIITGRTQEILDIVKELKIN